MNIITSMLKALSEVVVLTTVLAVPVVYDPSLYLWYSLSVVLAFVLRLGIEYKNNNLTWRNAFIQTVYTISYCYFAIIVWTTLFIDGKWFAVYLFINSLFAVMIVSQLEIIFEMGLKKWLRSKLKNFLALEDKEEDK